MLRPRVRIFCATACLAAFLAGALPVSVRAQGTNYQNANLPGANFQNASLQNVNFQNANLKNADLQGADLRGANLRGANLRGANLQSASLQGANLQGASLLSANLQYANSQDAIFQNADLQKANLQSVLFYGADLRGANLQQADLLGANLQTANLQNANLVDANLSGANLLDANLQGAKRFATKTPALAPRRAIVRRRIALAATLPAPFRIRAPRPSPLLTPAPAAAPPPSAAPSLSMSAESVFEPRQAMRALALLNAQTCAMRAQELVAQVTPTPSPSSSPAIPGAPLAPGQLYSTPFPRSSPVTPPPIPTPTPGVHASAGPVFLVRPSATPSIVPVGSPTPVSSPAPIVAPTLRPGYVAVIADKFVGNAIKPGAPGDAIGNVHIFYQDEVLVGDRAHYDGFKTLSITGNPYIANSTGTSVIYADQIEFDTIAQHAELVNGRGESSQGVERGLVYFSAKDLKTDEHGVAHGDYANVTTCERPRAGYHLTGRTIDVYPGDRLVISKAVLFLGAVAVFFLPKVIIPLRRIEDDRQRPSFFPEVGYNSFQGFYIKAKPGFGRDQYYFGYYRIEYYSRQGIGLGYTAYLAKRSGKRQSSVDLYAIHDRRTQITNSNLNVQDTENFSQTLRGHFAFTYNSNFGPLVNLPPNENFSGSIAHRGALASQNYTFAHSSISTQSATDNLGFTETRSFGPSLQNNLTVNYSTSRTNYGLNNASNNATGSFNDLLHWSNKAADYTLTYDKNFARNPYGINKEPELQIRPYAFLKHFWLPISSTFVIGQYNEPQTPLTTARADLNFTFGPALYHLIGSDLSATVNVHQLAYGTGDMKAAISQNATLSTAIGRHIVNAITYNASNFNGPPFLPFATLDQQSSVNYKSAADVLRFFNSDYYNLSLSFNTAFNRAAQPIQYQLALRPSHRSYVALGGSFIPGSGNGFSTTNVRFSTPLGNGSTLQFIGDIDWKNKARIINKSIYWSRIIGECYEIQLQYNQAARQLNLTLNLLAFPSHGATFGLNSTGSIIPTSFNF